MEDQAPNGLLWLVLPNAIGAQKEAASCSRKSANRKTPKVIAIIKTYSYTIIIATMAYCRFAIGFI